MTKQGELGSTLATAVMKEWAGRDLKQAADWVANADDRTRNRYSAPLVEAWAKQDAYGALAWCQSNLTGTSLASAVGAVMTGVAQKDIAIAAALVSGMQPSQARTEAAAAVAKKWFPAFVSDQSVKPETIAWLSRLDGNSLKRVLDQVQWGWVTSDPKSMADFLANASGEHVPTSTYSILAREIARKNPSEALEWASRLPDNRRLVAGGEAYSEWQLTQPEEASNWLNTLPASDPRRQPFFENAVRSLAYDSLAADRFAVMNDAERATAKTVIEKMTLPEDRRKRLLEVLTQR